ncbi:phosphonoacetaldehyde hydrolase [Lysinibacillus sp. KU-BSD001]|uniref:phosphonoacetaldehyde hydrolase n=1 Tax=Lysinibacillus sp. KU-BSD001 TaxID=3141328 RepID=UPI0036EB869F
MTKIEGIILDWAGTAVDFGCFAPVNVFLDIFKNAGVEVTLQEAREPMGMLKIDHIRTMLQMPRIQTAWQNQYGRASNEDDVATLYEQFEEQLMVSLATYTDPIPTVLNTVNALKASGVKVGSTTGYTRGMMDVVVPNAKAKGYEPHTVVTPDDVGGFGRPYPYMIFENMKRLGLQDVRKIVKVGDTTSDIREALHAGIWAVGVIIGSSEMGLSQQEFEALDEEQKQHVIHSTRQKFEAVGAHFTIETMEQLPQLIEEIEQQ